MSYVHSGRDWPGPEQLCARIETGLEAAEKSDDPLKELAAIMGDLRRLRRVFRSRRAELSDLEPRLKAIGQKLDDLASSMDSALADAWNDIDEEIRELQNEREACRELLLRLTKAKNLQTLKGENAELLLQLRSRLEVPPMASGSRRELENLLRSSPVWVEISEIRPLQLMRLWKQGGLHPHLAHRVGQLCRMVETLVVRDLSADGARISPSRPERPTVSDDDLDVSEKSEAEALDAVEEV